MGPGSKRAAVVAALVATVAASGGLGLRELASPAPAGAAPAAVELRIRIAASDREGAPVRLWHLRCKPAGGDWPSVAPACRRLRRELLTPIAIETEDYGRITRQPVRITGRAFDEVVSLRFPAMGSSTRAARLRALRTALGPRGFSQAERRSR